METSGLYFAVLDILRVMDEWINHSLATLLQCQTNWNKQTHEDQNQAAIIASNWSVLIYRLRQSSAVLLDQINKKTKEVESLRDGVSTNSL